MLLKSAIKNGFELNPSQIQDLCDQQDKENEAIKNEILKLAAQQKQDASMFESEKKRLNDDLLKLKEKEKRAHKKRVIDAVDMLTEYMEKQAEKRMMTVAPPLAPQNG
jgi:hypothetical protein